VAKLLGYASHAVLVLERADGQTPNSVLSFLDSLLEKAKHG